METAEFQKQVFTYDDIDDHLSRLPSQAYWSRVAFLTRLKRAGRLIRVRRGLFCLAPPGERAEELLVDPLLVASKLTCDSVISHGSALECLGLAPGPAGEAIYSAGRPLNPIVFRDRHYRGVKFPKSLVRSSRQRMLVKTVERGGSLISVTRAERALVDLLDRPDLAGGWAKTVKLLGVLSKLDLSEVVAYTRALANSTTAAKVGWYLTGRRDHFGDIEGHLIELSALKPNQPHYLDRSRRRDGRLVADWNLIVNCEE
ncbi:MAG: type IV toxin-antitoxin system AbiEi family antitoxin domain-containing protein [Deltaproteobacteria bacterium]|jgi:predicted transcriptional regulator of viral defense system|nr:type IV toxin-antitoxin system AbiEi family antitoxin domain-containing protein [Deltaproteobacteria bacterium]